MPDASGQIYALEDVYGISRDVPLNYASRPMVDGLFVDALKRTEHIVVHGSSKQGKTSLRRRTLAPNEYVDVTCADTWQLSDLHAAILKEVGYRVEQTTTRSESNATRATISFRGSASIPGLGGLEATTGYEDTRNTATNSTTRPLELDLADPNDIVRALAQAGSANVIVLEDFHYLPTDTQRHFSFSLKAYHERSDLIFIVVAVWLEENRLTQFNGDLVGRVIDVNADSWTSEELRNVINLGADLLNVSFDELFVATLLDACHGSVYLVQEACRRVCEQDGVFKTATTPQTVGTGHDAGDVVARVVNESSGRYRGFLYRFAEGFRETELEMYKWILLPILEVEERVLEHGIPIGTIRELLADRHPRGENLNAGSLSQALGSIVSLQSKLDVRPTILDYDATSSRLRIVDRSFAVWLVTQDRAELANSLGLANGTPD
jgi:hypothetical protein